MSKRQMYPDAPLQLLSPFRHTVLAVPPSWVATTVYAGSAALRISATASSNASGCVTGAEQAVPAQA